MERPIGSQLFVKGSGLKDGHLGSSSDSLESLSSIQTQASNFTESEYGTCSYLYHIFQVKLSFNFFSLLLY